MISNLNLISQSFQGYLGKSGMDIFAWRVTWNNKYSHFKWRECVYQLTLRAAFWRAHLRLVPLPSYSSVPINNFTWINVQINQPTNHRSLNQSLIQSINQSLYQSLNHSINHSINHLFNQLINQLINHWIRQSII